MPANTISVVVADDRRADRRDYRKPGANDKCAERDPDDPWSDADTNHQHSDRRTYNEHAHYVESNEVTGHNASDSQPRTTKRIGQLRAADRSAA